jgi:hypothetical protein
MPDCSIQARADHGAAVGALACAEAEGPQRGANSGIVGTVSSSDMITGMIGIRTPTVFVKCDVQTPAATTTVGALTGPAVVFTPMIRSPDSRGWVTLTP